MLKIFSPKKSAKIVAILLILDFLKHLIITLDFEKNAIFSQKIGKNRRK
jgi:hypothetical protein